MIDMNRVTIARIELRQQAPSLGTVSRIISALASKDVPISADAFLSTNTLEAAE
jgi:predicted transcriptional regulator